MILVFVSKFKVIYQQIILLLLFFWLENLIITPNVLCLTPEELNIRSCKKFMAEYPSLKAKLTRETSEIKTEIQHTEQKIFKIADKLEKKEAIFQSCVENRVHIEVEKILASPLNSRDCDKAIKALEESLYRNHCETIAIYNDEVSPLTRELVILKNQHLDLLNKRELLATEEALLTKKYQDYHNLFFSQNNAPCSPHDHDSSFLALKRAVMEMLKKKHPETGSLNDFSKDPLVTFLDEFFKS